MRWQPIETAPTDATPVLILAAGRIRPALMNWGRWFEDTGQWRSPRIHDKPTHWMPLPEPPE